MRVIVLRDVRYRGRYEKYIQSFIGKPERKKSFERRRHRWDDAVKINVERTEWGYVLRYTTLEVFCKYCS
jgi:hypothetical protein